MKFHLKYGLGVEFRAYKGKNDERTSEYII